MKEKKGRIKPDESSRLVRKKKLLLKLVAVLVEAVVVFVV